MITTRDLQVVDFIREYKIASTSTIAEVFFSSPAMCYRRLRVLCNKELKIIQDSYNAERLYCIKRPKQIRHSLLVTDFYRELHKRAEIVDFKIEPVMGSIRPDAVFGYRKGSKNYLGLLEVEISHKGFNFAKYERFYNSETYKNFLPVMPTVFVVGDNIKLPSNSKIKYVVIKTDFSNLGGVL
jgi:hypothetical protein